MSSDLENVADLALTEITRRFKDAPKDIPDHVLAKYFTDINKTIERREANLEQEEESEPFDLMAELGTLPFHRAKKLALEEAERFEAEADKLRQWVKEHDAVEV